MWGTRVVDALSPFAASGQQFGPVPRPSPGTLSSCIASAASHIVILRAILRVILLDRPYDPADNQMSRYKMPATGHPPRTSKIAPTPTSPVASLRRKYSIPQALLARLLDISLRSVSALESEAVTPGRAARRLKEVKRLCDALSEVSKASYIGQWLQLPNKMLGGLKPVEALERGQSDLVWRVVEGLRRGSQS